MAEPNRRESKLWGSAIIERLGKTEAEMETLLAHLRSVVATGKTDPTWTGWVHAIEMLIPDSEPRIEEFKGELRAKGLGHLADRLDALQEGGHLG